MKNVRERERVWLAQHVWIIFWSESWVKKQGKRGWLSTTCRRTAARTGASAVGYSGTRLPISLPSLSWLLSLAHFFLLPRPLSVFSSFFSFLRLPLPAALFRGWPSFFPLKLGPSHTLRPGQSAAIDEQPAEQNSLFHCCRGISSARARRSGKSAWFFDVPFFHPLVIFATFSPPPLSLVYNHNFCNKLFFSS